MIYQRERLPKKRRSTIYELEIHGGGQHCKMFITLGAYEDGRLGEIWIDCAKEGSFLRGVLSGWAISVSKAIQSGVPAREAVRTSPGSYPPSGEIGCDAVPAIHGKVAPSPLGAIAMLVEAETDEHGVLTDHGSEP